MARMSRVTPGQWWAVSPSLWIRVTLLDDPLIGNQAHHWVDVIDEGPDAVWAKVRGNNAAVEFRIGPPEEDEGVAR